MLKIFWRSIADCQSSPAAQISDKDTKRRKDSHPACPQPQRGRGLLAAEILLILVFLLQIIDASMGPRLVSRGNSLSLTRSAAMGTQRSRERYLAFGSGL